MGCAISKNKSTKKDMRYRNGNQVSHQIFDQLNIGIKQARLLPDNVPQIPQQVVTTSMFKENVQQIISSRQSPKRSSIINQPLPPIRYTQGSNIINQSLPPIMCTQRSNISLPQEIKYYCVICQLCITTEFLFTPCLHSCHQECLRQIIVQQIIKDNNCILRCECNEVLKPKVLSLFCDELLFQQLAELVYMKQLLILFSKYEDQLGRDVYEANQQELDRIKQEYNRGVSEFKF